MSKKNGLIIKKMYDEVNVATMNRERIATDASKVISVDRRIQ